MLGEKEVSSSAGLLEKCAGNKSAWRKHLGSRGGFLAMKAEEVKEQRDSQCGVVFLLLFCFVFEENA